MSDTMLHGVLNMPPDLWNDSELDKMQRHARYKQASERIALLESALSDLLGLQNGCPLPSYQNEYDEVIARASELLGGL